MADASRTALEEGQTWIPKNGDPLRQIQEIRAAGMFDSRRPMGSILVSWATNASRGGICSERAFKKWIKHTEATKGSREE